jgi:serine/threonine protein kinase
VELKNSENKTKESYALKYIRKIDCVRADFAHNIIRERRILQELEHPLIVNLRYAFQDEEFMYMVSDLMYTFQLSLMINLRLGGDLRFHINRKTFTEEAIRFWIAEVACALRYLHTRGIVHRYHALLVLLTTVMSNQITSSWMLTDMHIWRISTSLPIYSPTGN